MAEETKTIRIVIDASKAVDGSRAATAALERMERAQAGTADSLGRMEVALGRVGGILKAQLALMIAEIGARFIQMAKDSFDAAAGLGELAEQLGVSTEGLQALQYSATQSGVKLEQLETGISKFSQKIGEAAGGSKEMITALNNMGVKILDARGGLRSTETLLSEVAASILKIEDPAKRAAASVDFFGKAGTRMLPMLGDLASGMETLGAKARAAGVVISEDTIKKLDTLADRAAVAALHTRTLFAELAAPIATEAFDLLNRKLAETIGQLERGKISGKGFWETVLADSRRDGRMGGLRLSTPEEQAADRIAALRRDAANPNNADPQRQRMIQDDLDRVRAEALQSQADAASSFYSTETNLRLKRPVDPPGTSNPLPTGSGKDAEDAAKKYEKLIQQLNIAAVAQDNMTSAARRGDVAFQEQQIAAAAAQKALELFGKTLEQNDPRLRKIIELMTRDVQGKVAQAFVVSTTELEKQNKLLEAEIRLMDALPEIRERELGLIKLKFEAEKAGSALTAEDIENRKRAVEVGARLKTQADELKRAQELWTEPLKQALRDIQSAGANAFDEMLKNGEFSFRSLGDTFKTIIRRMAAEFLALATIRPVMSVMVQGMSSTGLVGPSFGQSLGLSGSGSGLFGGLGGGGGSSSLFSPGFMNTPIFGGIDNEIANWSTYGTSAQNSLGGTTWGQAFGVGGGLLSMGMGVNSLLNSKSTGGTIGGIAGILGGGLGIAGALMPAVLGGALGPIGMAVGLLGSFLPGLFGEEYKLPPLVGSGANFTVGGNGLYGNSSNTSENGGTGTAGTSQFLANALNNWVDRAGTGVDASKMWGFGIWNNQRDGTSANYLLDPYGNSTLKGEGSGDQTPYYWATISEAFKNSVLSGGVVGASPTLKTALGNRDVFGEAQINALLDLVEAYDRLGKVTSGAETELEKINTTFQNLIDGANAFGLSLEPIEAERKKFTERFAQDFIDSMLDPAAVQLRQLHDQRDEAIRSAEYIRDNVENVYVDMAKISEYWLKKEADLKEQLYSQTTALIDRSIEHLQSAIERLTLGDLANLSPTAAFAGQEATYQALLAQAQAGDALAREQLAGAGTALAEAGRSYFASGPEYEALRQQILKDLTAAITINAVPAATRTADPAAANANTAAIAQLTQLVETMVKENTALRADLVYTNDLLYRYVAGKA